MKPADCQCSAVLVDWVRGVIGHPYRACPHYGTTTTATPREEPCTALALVNG